MQIGPETVMTTLYTAKKYAVPALEKHCVDFLKRNLSPDNAFMLLTQVSYFLFIYYFSSVLWIRDILVRIRILHTCLCLTDPDADPGGPKTYGPDADPEHW